MPAPAAFRYRPPRADRAAQDPATQLRGFIAMAIGFWILALLVALAPLPFGAVEPWAWAALGTGVGGLLVLWALTLALSRRPLPASPRRLWYAIVPFVAVAAWAAVQLWPGVPQAWQHPMWAIAGRVLGTELVGSISVDRYLTGNSLLRLLAFGGIFWLSLQHCRDVANAQRVLRVVAVAAVVYAAYGLAVHFTGTQKILWYDKLRYLESVTATFYYKNSFAAYCGLALIAALGILLVTVTETTGAGFGRRETARVLLSRLVARDWVAICALVVVTTALLLANSRGGFLAAGIGVLTLLVTVRLGVRGAARGATAVGAVVAAAMAVFVLVSGGSVLDRIGDAAQDLGRTATIRDDRPVIYGLTATAIQDAPVLGTGYGTFPEVFRFYRTPELHRQVLQAHNTYLELALELGVPAAAALILGVACLGALCVAGIARRRRDIVYPAVGVAATVMVGTHALADFTIQTPAVAATYFMLMGAACAQSWSRPPRSAWTGTTRRQAEPASAAAAADDLALEGSERLQRF